ncbi:Glutamate-ammonia-ligase adenylyltransferase [Oceaniovalibus guishaninsula JLT2003]|uniref:Glutamate-ammonia-ligase adenylyltransferase n=1 Tax=Oceaniovalibus guishaninsula JLT2003 TaxID=1231392 RepID=K2HCG6_9RHOB|nr:[glutamate--ammonia-ligase] adenylyltransferase [Oceaniovalibus guishaninsula]EKE45118.1 Glutamate-ammonia-ligase adenylyltransferase [Oceaniovalibus guishaninsula JLT2003]
MTFADRITRLPRPHEPDRAKDALASCPSMPSPLGDLLVGAAGSSPHLADLIRREAQWIAAALQDAPERALRSALDDLRAADDRELAAALRLAKRRIGLLTALADLAGVWPLKDVTGALTGLADLAVARAVTREVGIEIARGRLPGQGPDDVATAGGLFVLAMGKMGANELNYSSDIDLICLFDDERYAPGDVATVRSVFVKAVRRAMALLSDTGPDGYVFRTDLRLRPDPGVTPIVMSASGAESYYEQLGRTWERAAHIKARPCAGDIAAGMAYLDRLRPFVWRRHLDFAAIRDAHDMRLRIRDHRGLHGPLVLEGHDMKLGRGGIREIEFFTQTRQIIAGGRDPSLRVSQTVAGLERLRDAGWIGADTCTTLIADYRAHREVEHRLQMIADAQTHALPTNSAGFERLAALMGTDTRLLRGEVGDRLARVERLTESFFAPDRPSDGMPDLTDEQRAVIARWRALPLLRSERALDIFDRILPRMMTALLATPRPDQALMAFDGFLAGLPAGVQLFSLFEANPHLTDLIADIAGTSPQLAQYLGRNSAVLDAVIGGSFFDPWRDDDHLAARLDRRIAKAADYEARLDETRRWQRDWHFRIGVHHLRGLIDGAQASHQYAALARTVLQALWPMVVAEFAARHGPPPGRGAAVVAMGSLGAGRLTARSDLDLIVVYDPADTEASDGRKPLAVRPYYARLTQALVTALSAPMAAGRLYEVDMRLRPSGQQGPVATSLTSFETYQRNDAWTWEHLALTRAHPVAGEPPVMAEIERIRTAILTAPHDTLKIRHDLADMRARLRSAKAADETKSGPGRLQDIELAATALGLLTGCPARAVAAQLAAGRRDGLLTPSEYGDLVAAHDHLTAIRMVERLLGADSLDPESLGAAGQAFLMRETATDDPDTLRARTGRLVQAAASVIDRLFRDI